MGQDDGTYTATMDPNEYANMYQNINPYTQQAANSLYGGNMNNFISQGLQYNPNQGFETFMSQQANPLAQMVSGSMSPLQESLNQRAQQLSTNAVDNVSGQFAGNNALFSSAFGEKAMQAGAQPFADVANMLGQQQIGLTGQLWNNQMGLAQQQQQAQMQAAMQALGQQAQFGQGNYVAPDLQYNPTFWEQLTGGVGDALGLASGALNFASGVKDFG